MMQWIGLAVASTPEALGVGAALASIQDGFSAPDRYWEAGDHRLTCTAKAKRRSFFEAEIRGVEGADVHLFFCRPDRFSMHELNVMCVVASDGIVSAWTHLWNHDAHLRTLAQEGTTAEGPCTLRADRLSP